MDEPSGHPELTITVYAAACTGLLRTSHEVGLPLAHVGVARNVETALERLNRRQHGSGAFRPDHLEPLKCENGWDDWEAIPLGIDYHVRAEGLGMDRDRMTFAFNDPATVACFDARLRCALTPLNLNEVIRSPRWLIARTGTTTPVLVQPRYTIDDRCSFRRGASLVDDLYALDPVRHGDKLASLAREALTSSRRLADAGAIGMSCRCRNTAYDGTTTDSA